MEKTEEALLEAAREASAYFDRFDKSCLFHAAAHVNLDWLLSDTPAIEPQGGLITDLSPPDFAGRYAILFPKSQTKQLRLQEMHQIVRELVEGIYVFNQIPSISLDTNHDSTMSVNIPSAYNDSLVGEALLAVDYYVKSLLHDSTIAQKDKRGKLLDAWKKFPLVNLREEFQANGMIRMQDDNELGKKVYEKKKISRSRFPSRCVNSHLARHQLAPRKTTGEEFEQQQAHVCRETFLQYLDQVSLGLVIRQKEILQSGNVFLLNTATDVVSGVLAMQCETGEASLSANLHAYLQKQRDFVSENLRRKADISWYVDLLSFVSFMIYFLVTLKKQNKIILVNNLIHSRSKDVMRTERDLPPTFPSPSSRWSPHKHGNTGVHGGIHFMKSKLGTRELEISSSDMDGVQKIILSPDTANKSMSSISTMEREIPTCEINNQTHYIVVLQVEPYYSKTPKLPRWVHAMTHELKVQGARLPQLNDGRIQDLLRKPLGPRKASTLKTVNVSLQASIENGLLPAVMALLKRCTQTRLVKPDANGMTMLHYAAAHAQADIISALMIAGSNIQFPVSPPDDSNCRTEAIHLAAKTGDLDALCSLISYGADLCAMDSNGWAPIHHAAFHNCQIVIRHLASVSPLMVDLETRNKNSATPLLLAAQNGCFDSFTCLTELGADLGRTTRGEGSNVVHLAAQRHHTGILKYLVQRGDKGVSVWQTLSEMLKSDGADVAARNLDPLTRWKLEYAEQLLEQKAVESLVQLLKRDETLQLFSIQVLANISGVDSVRSALVSTDVIPLLVKLLASTNDRIQVNACLVLSDLGVVPQCQDTIAAAGAIPGLIKLLSSEVDDVQLFSCACIGILAYDNPKNQSTVAQAEEALSTLVSMLRSSLSCIQGCAANTLQAILEGNRANQLSALSEKIISPLVILLRSKEPSIYSNAARTIEALAVNCVECQQELLSDSTCINLLKRLLKMRDYSIKVRGGCALWAIAGVLISNKRLIATHMGLVLLVDMLTVHNEKLDFVCSEALGALATELGDNQDHIIQVGGVKPLVEVLTIPTSQRVCLSVIHTLAALCMKPALVPNPVAQTAIGKSRGVIILSSIISTKDTKEIVRVEAACTLAKLLLDHEGNDKILAKHTSFSFLTIFQFFTSPDALVRLLAGYCLSIMAFNNPTKLQEMKNSGSLNMSNFTPFLQSTDQFYQVHAALQIVVLSKLLTGIRGVNAVVRGVKLLVSLLSSDVEQTKVLSAEFIASLSRTGGGLPGVLIMAATLDPLMMNLSFGNGPVIESTCVALGYLTFNPMASRLIIGMFRDNPELFLLFKEYFPLIIYSQKFFTEWNHITRPGIPTLCLESRGGRSILTGQVPPRTPMGFPSRHRNAIAGVISSTTANTANTSNTAETRRDQLSRMSSHTAAGVSMINPKLEISHQLPPTAEKMKSQNISLKQNLVSFRPMSYQPVGLLTKRKLQLQNSFDESSSSQHQRPWSEGIRLGTGLGKRRSKSTGERGLGEGHSSVEQKLVVNY